MTCLITRSSHCDQNNLTNYTTYGSDYLILCYFFNCYNELVVLRCLNVFTFHRKRFIIDKIKLYIMIFLT